MLRHSIDVTPELSNEDIYATVKYVLSKEFEDKEMGLRVIGSILNGITTKPLLENTINLLRGIGFFKKADTEYITFINDSITRQNYSQFDLLRIKAIYYDCWFQYEFLNRAYKAQFKEELPRFKITLQHREIITNEDVINDYYSTESRQQFLKHLKSIPSTDGQISEIKKAIYTLSASDFKDGTDFFRDDIKRLETLKENTFNVLPNGIELPFYVEVGQFFYDGSIRSEKGYFYFKGQKFTTVTQLSKHVQSVLKTPKSVRQYISDTLSENGEKNLYDPFKAYRLENVIAYCKEKGIKPSTTFIEKIETLGRLH